MSTIADNIAELMRIKLEQRDYFSIGEDVPFTQYIDYMKWGGEPIPQQPLMADFVNKRYSIDGVPCRFEDIFEFERLSKAWQFAHGQLKEYEVNEPRFSSEGLLIEPKHQNKFPTTLFSKVSNLDKTQVVDDYFLSNSFKSTKFIGVTQDVEDKTNGYWYKSKVDVTGVDGLNPSKRIGFILDLSKAKSVRYLRVHTYPALSNTHKYPSILDIDNLEVLNVGNSVSDISTVYFGNLLFLTYTTTHTSVAYTTFNVQFGLEGDNWEDRSTWRALPEGEEVILSCQQWANDFDKPLLSVIPSVSTPTTRLPDTLKVSHDGVVVCEADEGIQVNGNEITGFGYIRKLEVK